MKLLPNSDSTGNSSPPPDFPFPGLRPYDFRDAHCFFGRYREVEDLLHRLASTRFIVILGESGCGKSSLVRAGLLPHLNSGGFVDSGKNWWFAVTTPGQDPIRRLGNALSGARSASDLARVSGLTVQGLGDDVDALISMEGALPERDRLLIVVDQFEELFHEKFMERRDWSAIANTFVQTLLAGAAQSRVPIFVVLTMRADFLGRCALISGMPEAINSHCLYLVPRMSPRCLREMIQRPIEQVGGRIAQNVVDDLLLSVGDDPDHLPLLQHALARLWSLAVTRKTQGEDTCIDFRLWHDLLETAGLADPNQPVDLTQRLSRLLDYFAELDGASHDQSDLPQLEAVFRNICRADDGKSPTRNPQPLGLLSKVAGTDLLTLANRINPLRNHGPLLVAKSVVQETSFGWWSQDSGDLAEDSLIDVPHECVPRHWKRLKGWLADDARIRQQLEHVARISRESSEHLRLILEILSPPTARLSQAAIDVLVSDESVPESAMRVDLKKLLLQLEQGGAIESSDVTIRGVPKVTKVYWLTNFGRKMLQRLRFDAVLNVSNLDPQELPLSNEANYPTDVFGDESVLSAMDRLLDCVRIAANNGNVSPYLTALQAVAQTLEYEQAQALAGVGKSRRDSAMSRLFELIASLASSQSIFQLLTTFNAPLSDCSLRLMLPAEDTQDSQDFSTLDSLLALLVNGGFLASESLELSSGAPIGVNYAITKKGEQVTKQNLTPAANEFPVESRTASLSQTHDEVGEDVTKMTQKSITSAPPEPSLNEEQDDNAVLNAIDRLLSNFKSIENIPNLITLHWSALRGALQWLKQWYESWIRGEIKGGYPTLAVGTPEFKRMTLACDVISSLRSPAYRAGLEREWLVYCESVWYAWAQTRARLSQGSAEVLWDRAWSAIYLARGNVEYVELQSDVERWAEDAAEAFDRMPGDRNKMLCCYSRATAKHSSWNWELAENLYAQSLAQAVASELPTCTLGVDACIILRELSVVARRAGKPSRAQSYAWLALADTPEAKRYEDAFHEYKLTLAQALNPLEDLTPSTADTAGFFDRQRAATLLYEVLGESTSQPILAQAHVSLSSLLVGGSAEEIRESARHARLALNIHSLAPVLTRATVSQLESRLSELDSAGEPESVPVSDSNSTSPSAASWDDLGEPLLDSLDENSKATWNELLSSTSLPIMVQRSGFAGTQDTGVSDDEIEIRLQASRDAAKWENTVGSARRWWEAFEVENSQRRRLILRLLRELEARRTSITDFFMAYVFSDTDNIQANLNYLDYTQRKKSLLEAETLAGLPAATLPPASVPSLAEGPAPSSAVIQIPISPQKPPPTLDKLLKDWSTVFATKTWKAELVLPRTWRLLPALTLKLLARGQCEVKRNLIETLPAAIQIAADNPPHEAALQRLQVHKARIGVAEATGNAGGIWAELEEEATHNPWKLLALAMELDRRRATVTEFFAGALAMEIDDIPARLDYFEYDRLRNQERQRKAQEAQAARAEGNHADSNVPQKN